MKIAVISPNADHLASLSATLASKGHVPVAFEGGKSRLREVVERESPQLVLVDGICCDPAELSHVEQVTSRHPRLEVILLCSTTSPEFLIESMRAGVREVLPSPAPQDGLKAALDRAEARRSGTGLRRLGQVLAFVSCKGGSGATFLATQLGSQLAASRSVLLIDLNLQFGDALAFVHDGRPAATLCDLARDIGRLDASLLAASTVKVTPSFSVLPAPEDLGHAAEVRPEHVDAVVSLAAAHHDFVLLDLGRSLDTLTIRALDRATRIYLVMQSGLPDLRNARRLLEAFRTLGYAADRTEILLNRYEKSAEVSLEQVQRAVGPVRLHTVPNSWREVSSSINHGTPLPIAGRCGPVVRRLAELASSLSPRREAGKGLLDRLLRRA